MQAKHLNASIYHKCENGREKSIPRIAGMPSDDDR